VAEQKISLASALVDDSAFQQIHGTSVNKDRTGRISWSFNQNVTAKCWLINDDDSGVNQVDGCL